MTLAGDLIFAILIGLIVQAFALGKSAKRRYPELRFLAAGLWIYLSGFFYIAPFTYYAFRKGHPLLARYCLIQLAVGTVAWASVVAIMNNHVLSSMPGVTLE